MSLEVQHWTGKKLVFCHVVSIWAVLDFQGSFLVFCDFLVYYPLMFSKRFGLGLNVLFFPFSDFGKGPSFLFA
jgi:hypothetical protein